MKLNKFSKKIVTFVIIANCIFTAAILAIFFFKEVEPTTLIISWFAFTGTELLALAGIKITKNKQCGNTENGDTYEN